MSAGTTAAQEQRNTLQEESEILDSIGRWLERDVRPYVLELEHADNYPIEMVEQMKSLGLFGATIAEEYGGLGLLGAPSARVVRGGFGGGVVPSGLLQPH